jgi:coproporphyrinogen III oxidase-like Fe-S oxidoreductase
MCTINCSLAIVPIGPNVVAEVNTTSSSGSAAMNQHYTTALLNVLSNIAARQQSGDKKKTPLQTIYFGGGTPSLELVDTLALILDAI